ncbi:uncharacterized protein LDX57_009190 [Aspergillus melleus]|uniref:uncharacterized protein n=1 Tax=Aspergillus melleus TaxID=138277 RepID=UPI001E8D3F11|nr:uncharacterized protein LDX57_009190 [Aspergillus melleus]KAH8431528.1 hypothetical protein LDX57_009190 [Aspergillus melleus]
MRSIQLDSSCPPTYRAWSSPTPPEFHPWNVDRDSLLLQSRLDYFKIDSHIRGILVCCAITKNVGIHGFSGPSKAYRQFLDLMNRRLSDIHKYWMYFPLNKDEIIKAAWIRKARFSEVAINPILIVSQPL